MAKRSFEAESLFVIEVKSLKMDIYIKKSSLQSRMELKIQFKINAKPDSNMTTKKIRPFETRTEPNQK